jgi:hypothetical protein
MLRPLIRLRSFLLVGLALAGLLAAGRPARAGSADPLRQELADLAKGIQKVVEGQKQEAIAVGEFTGPGDIPGSAGAGIQLILIQELKALKVSVQKKANLEVKGDYLKVAKRDGSDVELRLKARIYDDTGDTVAELQSRLVKDERALAKLFGLTGHLPTDDDRERWEELNKRLNDPQVNLDRGVLRSQADSPFGVAVLVRKKGQAQPQARAPQVRDGLAFVPLDKGDIYEVLLVNDSSYDAAVTLTIDGVDQFAFSEVRDPKTGKPAYTHMIVPKRTRAVIRGWHRTNDDSHSFLITEYGKGAVSKLLRGSPKVGTITVSFAAAWTSDADKPGHIGKSATETGLGPLVKTGQKPVKRTIGPVEDVVSIRYQK